MTEEKQPISDEEMRKMQTEAVVKAEISKLMDQYGVDVVQRVVKALVKECGQAGSDQDESNIPGISWSANFSCRWFDDALDEVNSVPDVDSMRREIVFSTCFLESYIFEWARNNVDRKTLNKYFPEGRHAETPRKWKEVPKKLCDDKGIKAPDLKIHQGRPLILPLRSWRSCIGI